MASTNTSLDDELVGGFWAGWNSAYTAGVDGEPAAPGPLPTTFALHAPAPNPVMDHTVVAFDLPLPAVLRVQIYDAAGRLLRTLAEGSFPAGRYQRSWNATDDAGRAVLPGIYFVRLDAGAVRMRQKVVVIR